MKHWLLHTGKILLLSLAMLPSITTLFFQIKEIEIHRRMRKELDEQTLVTISISEKNFAWWEKEREIWVGDRLFDVKSWYKENGFFIVTGLFDDEETNLVRQAQKNQEEENEKRNEKEFKLFSFDATSQIHPEEDDLCITISRNFFNYTDSLAQQYSTIITPPPRSWAHFI